MILLDTFIIKSDYLFTYLLSPFNPSSIYIFKLLSSLFFLIFIRAGLPRYRYDYLTKLGWVKLLLLTVFTLSLTYAIITIY